MQAIQITEPESLTIIDQPIPEPGSEEVLLKIELAGFCGSDLSTWLGRNPMVSYPRIPGHEVAAAIVKTGTNVPPEFAAGTPVTVIPYTNCGNCPACRRNRANACQYNQTLGVQRDGAMREFISLPYEKVLPVAGLSAEKRALIEPLTVGTHAVNRAEVSADDTVMVMGCGMIGAGAIAAAASRGATVVAVDIDDTKLEIAAAAGATHTINSRSKDLHTALQELLDGNAPDVVVEAAGNPATYRAAVEEIAFTGRMVCIGYAKDEIAFATKLWVQKELDIRGSRNARPEDFAEVISLLQSGSFPADRVITAVVSPAETAAAFRDWATAPGKVMKLMLRF